MQAMENTAVLKRRAAYGQAAVGAAECFLNVLVIYQDATTRKWARDVCERVTRAVGREAIRSTWWKLDELNQPAVLAGAVSKAMRADVIVVAIRASEGFPVPFYWWTCSWLPHRVQETGALVALLTLPERPGPYMNRAREYLRAVARQGRLDFLVEERGAAPRNGGALRAEAPARFFAASPSSASTPSPLPRDSSRRWHLDH